MQSNFVTNAGNSSCLKPRQDFAREHGPDADYTYVARAIDPLWRRSHDGDWKGSYLAKVKSLEKAAGEEIRARGRLGSLFHCVKSLQNLFSKKYLKKDNTSFDLAK